jgi:hypothetical protein
MRRASQEKIAKGLPCSYFSADTLHGMVSFACLSESYEQLQMPWLISVASIGAVEDFSFWTDSALSEC